MSDANDGARRHGIEAGERTPEHGARFVLERLEGAPGAARYDLRIETRAQSTHEPTTLAASATITSADDVAFSAWSAEPEPWALEFVTGLCRTLGKNHAASGDWPAVLRRWRAPRESA